jgi:hypothetical protein
MLSYLLFVVSLVNQSGFVDSLDRNDKHHSAELKDGGATGGLIVTMGPVMNVHVMDVRVTSAPQASSEQSDELPAVTHKGSLFESFSKNRVFAIRYGRK